MISKKKLGKKAELHREDNEYPGNHFYEVNSYQSTNYSTLKMTISLINNQKNNVDKERKY